MTSREDNRRLAEAYNEAMGIGDTNLHEEVTDDPADFSHDYAACQDPICPLCEAYGDGYTAGKEKAYFEGPHLAPEGTRSVVRVQPLYGREIGDRETHWIGTLRCL